MSVIEAHKMIATTDVHGGKLGYFESEIDRTVQTTFCFIFRQGTERQFEVYAPLPKNTKADKHLENLKHSLPTHFFQMMGLTTINELAFE